MKKVVLILAVVFSTMTQAQENKPQVPQISVTGEGKIKVVPDRAIISVGVLNTGKDSKEVKTLNDETVDKVIKFLKKSVLLFSGVTSLDPSSNDPKNLLHSPLTKSKAPKRKVMFSLKPVRNIRMKRTERKSEIGPSTFAGFVASS